MSLGTADERVYGVGVEASLRPVQQAVAWSAERFTERLYDELGRTSEGARVLQALLPEEFERLKSRQAEHLRLLFSPTLSLAEHQAAAQRAGRAHALVGVDLTSLIESYGAYQQEIHAEIMPLVACESREEVAQIVNRRIFADLQAQAMSYRRIEVELALAVSQIDELIQGTGNFSDLVRGVMGVIGDVDGDVSAFFARCDAQGELQIEASQGASGHRYHEAMMSGLLPRISIDPGRESGQGPGGRAWRNGQVIISEAWALESRNKPWQGLGTELGFRSSAAVPLLDDSGKTIALLSLYSAWPRFFSTLRIGNFLNHVQKALSHAVQRLSSTPVVPLPRRQIYRRWISEGRVRFLYQPIIDLRSGELVKVEALARLVDEQGHLVSPERFLPACGNEELFALLQLGLDRACVDAAGLQDQGLRAAVALNFPAEGIGDPRCERAILQALQVCRPRGIQLELEVLESHEGQGSDERRNAFLQGLREAGVRLAEDDLGSGHSSLLRLDQYAFDDVKMDQGLVRGATGRPQRALEFMFYLTRLVHAFGMRLTVEGLEHRGLIESAAILGADQGQGYGIARPMPIEQVAQWHAEFRFDIDPLRPRTALGALATYLLWDMQLGSAATDGQGGVVNARQTVRDFIAERGLQHTELARLLDEHFRRGASARPRIRHHVIERFTEIWCAELAASS
jgi:EAL domain-containing protein (putative c-di-GMP-specific phosphodiesterase class I)